MLQKYAALQPFKHRCIKELNRSHTLVEISPLLLLHSLKPFYLC